MMTVQAISGSPDFLEFERPVVRFWNGSQAFDKFHRQRERRPIFCSVDGPSTVKNPIDAKEYGFEIRQSIELGLQGCTDELRRVIAEHRSSITGELLAPALLTQLSMTLSRQWNCCLAMAPSAPACARRLPRTPRA
jgi:hypothetical protein